MHYKKQVVNRLELLRTRLETIRRNSERGVPFNRDDFTKELQSLVNRVDEVLDTVGLEPDDTTRFVGNSI